MSVRHSIKRKKIMMRKIAWATYTVALLLHGDLETKSGFLLLIKKNSHRADFI